MEKLTAYRKIINAKTKKTFPDGKMALEVKRYGHEITTPPAILDSEENNCDIIHDPASVVLMIDHVLPAKDPATAEQGKMIRAYAKKHGIHFLDVGQGGVCHAVIPQYGFVMPGDAGVMGDSHTCTGGAFCAFTAGVGSSEFGDALRTKLSIFSPQEVIRVNIIGNLPANVFAKDIILRIINKIGVKGATNCILEFGGNIVDEMSMEARMTLTNMSVEAGATSGMINADYTTLEYLWPVLQERHGYSDKDKAFQEITKWNSDPDCNYHDLITIDVSDMTPKITQNFSPGDVIPISEFDRKHVDQVYIGSCTNGRIEDLRIAAACFKFFLDKGIKIPEGMRCIVVPATEVIWDMAMEEGLFKIFKEAGCIVANASCGACLGMSCGVQADGEVTVSTTNRNFDGRMGKGGMVHLVSPATAAFTAMNGCTTEPPLDAMKHIMSCGIVKQPRATAIAIPLKTPEYKSIDFASYLKGSDNEVIDFSGKVCFLERNGETVLAPNVNTDEIVPAKYLTAIRKDVYGEHCLEDLAMSKKSEGTLTGSQIVVGGENFGMGSSREHAVWAFNSSGIKCVIATSFARIFYDNMFNNHLLCIELSENDIQKLYNTDPKEIKINTDICTIEWDNGYIEFKALTSKQKELVDTKNSTDARLKLAAEIYPYEK